ncbi:MAG: hypothetical protein KIT33_11200 [Candidatus Kapabacteria bacterium]|nr:hypothetical protein [Ignavibacteriota bacterium]MCW5885524.1 hypothetical protein [Candidatus Kapabacteria bacterium]
MQNNENSYKLLIDKINSTRRKENSLILGTGLFKVFAITLLTVILAGFIEMAAHGDTLLRTILAGSVFISFIVSFGLFAMPGILRFAGVRNHYDDNGMALRIGDHFTDIKDNLGNALQMIPISKNPGGVSSSLALAAFEEISRKISGRNFDEIIKYDEIKKSVIYFAIALFTFGISNIAFPDAFGSALGRVADFRTSYLPAVPFSLTIEPLEESVLRGDKVKITVKAEGIAPDEITLHIKEDKQEAFDEISLKLNDDNEYIYEVNSLKNTIFFYGRSEWYREPVITNRGVIYVIDKPIIKSISGKLNYPSYTSQPASFFTEQNADFTALVGSKAEFEILSNKELQKAEIKFIKKDMTAANDSSAVTNDTIIYSLKVNGKRASGDLRINNSGNYFIELTDFDIEKSENPIVYSVIAIQDAFPSIKLIEPLSDTEVNTNALLPIRVRISDDYGLSKLTLNYRLSKSPYALPDENFTTYEIKFIKGESEIEVPYVWDLNKLGIMPEDVFEFYLEVADNDIVNGPKKARTQTLSVRLPSLEEVQKESELVQAKIEKDLDKIMKEALEIKKDLDELNRDLMKEKNKMKEPDWKQKKKAEDIAKKQQELKEKMSEMSKSLEDATEKLQENQMISPETLEKYKELQNLMKQVDSPELRRMQEKMQEAMKNMNQDQLQKAMEQFKFDDEQFRKNIERSMKILKRLQAEQKTDALRKRAEELAKQQDELAEETAKSNPDDKSKQNELAKRQEKIQKELNNIEKELKNLEDLMKEIGEQEMPMDDLQKAMDDLKPEETNQEMSDSKENMKSGDMHKSKKNQQNASKNLKDFAKQMQKMKEGMQQQNAQEAIDKMEKYVSDMLELSKKQENVKNNTASSDYNSTRLPQHAQTQAELFESLMSVAQSMAALSEKSFAVTSEMANEVSNALNEMRQSVEMMADRNTQKAAASQSAAMGAMNRAASQMQDMVGAMKAQQNGSCDNPGGQGEGGGGGSGMTPGMSMSQKMQEIAAQQQAINQAMQQMMQGGQGGGGQSSMERQAEMSRLADKQGGARKSLEELAKEQKEISGGDKEKLAELDKIAKEMQEILQDMKVNGVTPETMRKQEKILSRLLDATRSVHDRDYEKEREGKSADNIFRKSPGAIDFNTQEGREKALRDMMKANQRGYTKDYENLIRAYFESLKKATEK